MDLALAGSKSPYKIFLAESLHSSESQIWHLQSQDNHKDLHGERSSDLLMKNTMLWESHIIFIIITVIYYYYSYVFPPSLWTPYT